MSVEYVRYLKKLKLITLKKFKNVVLVSSLFLLVAAMAQSPLFRGVNDFLGDANLGYERSVSGLNASLTPETSTSQRQDDWQSQLFCANQSQESIVFLKNVSAPQDSATEYQLIQYLYEPSGKANLWNYRKAK